MAYAVCPLSGGLPGNLSKISPSPDSPLFYPHSEGARATFFWPHRFSTGIPGASPEEEITLPGMNCDILTARDKVRSVTHEGKQKLYRLWGSREFIARAKLLLSSLPDPKDEVGLYTVQALTAAANAA